MLRFSSVSICCNNCGNEFAIKFLPSDAETRVERTGNNEKFILYCFELIMGVFNPPEEIDPFKEKEIDDDNDDDDDDDDEEEEEEEEEEKKKKKKKRILMNGY